MKTHELQGRIISFEEMRMRPTLFLEYLKENNESLFEKVQKSKNLATQAKRAMSALEGADRDKMSIIAEQADARYNQDFLEAETWVASNLHRQQYENDNDKSNGDNFSDEPDKSVQLQPKQTQHFERNEIANSSQRAKSTNPTNLPSEVNPTEIVYRRIAQAILMLGITSQIEIARHTGFSLSKVTQTIRSAEFQNFLNLASEQLPATGVLTTNGRLRELVKQKDQIERIIFERAMSATPAHIVSDSDFLELGLSPDIRDPQMFRVPGASQGLIKKTVVVSRVLGGEGRGGRSELVNNYEFDTSLQTARERLIKEIRIEMQELGAIAKTTRKTYGFDTDGI